MLDTLSWQPLFTLRLKVGYADIQAVGDVPAGKRGIFPVEGGTFEGPRMKGVVMGAGADWVLWRPDGAMIIDVRTALQTDDGAIISMAYQGLAYGRTPEAQARFNRREVVDDADLYARTCPRFETADPRYEWLNRVIAVANGARTEGGPIYHVFAIT